MESNRGLVSVTVHPARAVAERLARLRERYRVIVEAAGAPGEAP